MGLAPDGGLALPQEYPQISRNTLDAWRKLSYPELAFEILSLFADDIPVFSGNRVVRFDPFNQGWEYTLGMTYYPTGHSYLKIQAEGAYVRHSPISAEKSEFVAGTHESDLIGRVQLQLEF